MSPSRLIIAALVLAVSGTVEAQEPRLLFVGDILAERGAREPEVSGSWLEQARGAQLVVGNLEGALGEPSTCVRPTPQSPCFAMPETMAGVLARAGFTALGMENNHAGDLGPEALVRTARVLSESGVFPLRYESSPTFLKVGEVTVGLVSLSRVSKGTGPVRELPSVELARKLRQARRLSNVVVVYVHWGEELFDWPHPTQRQAARWLVKHGADLIIGHHPHVVQPPECVEGRPVYFSVGNFRFRDRYPAGRVGLAADCRVVGRSLHCGGLATSFPVGSSWPEVSASPETEASLKACEVPLHETEKVGGLRLQARSVQGELPVAQVEVVRDGRVTARVGSGALVSLETGRVVRSGEPWLFALERHFSPLDGETALRPYVYEARGERLVARWRGSGLAWPLLDARLLPEEPGVLCALHRMDSFVALRPSAPGVRVAAYRWAGFGFRGDDAEELHRRCEALLSVE
ncbi:CapA family protein [Hyalangium versicolor]|uniref:CapA family protein n=1 Tax=Hyalangium versicolor TaxID=2861190 RepID=UPI001CCAA3AE|nr:CapA family protein [Hyalangium versicolor]